MWKPGLEDESDTGWPYTELLSDEPEPEIQTVNAPAVTVEPMVFVNVVGLGALYVTYQSFMIKSICLNRIEQFNSTPVDCDNLQAFRDEEAAVEQEAVHYLAYKRMLETSITIFYALFLGDWIHRNGSKSMMVLPLAGFLFSALYLVLISIIPGLHPGFIVLSALPAGLGGANFSIILSTNTFITNVTTTKNRSFRLSMAEGSAILGFPIGLWIGAELAKSTGYTGVFILCTVLQLAALLYTIAFIRNDGPQKWLTVNMFKHAWTANAAKDITRFCTRARDDSKRMWLFLLYVTWSLRLFTFSGLDTVMYLYTRHTFEWSSVEFTNFITADALLCVAGILVVSFLGMKVLKLQDATIGVLGTLGTICAPLVVALSTVGWMVYLALGFQMFAGVISIVVRAIITKLVAPDEVPTAFVISGILEAAVPMTSAPIYGMIYGQTLHSFPTAVFFVTAVGNAISGVLFGYLALRVPVSEKLESMTHSASMGRVD